MDDPQSPTERAELISRMFALITGKLEDATALAAECQGRRPAEELRGKSEELARAIDEAMTLSQAALVVLER